MNSIAAIDWESWLFKIIELFIVRSYTMWFQPYILLEIKQNKQNIYVWDCNYLQMLMLCGFLSFPLKKMKTKVYYSYTDSRKTSHKLTPSNF